MILFKLIFLLFIIENKFAESNQNELVKFPSELESYLINAGKNFEESREISSNPNIPILYYNKGLDLPEYKNDEQFAVAPQSFLNFQDIFNSLFKWLVPDVPAAIEPITLLELIFTVSVNVLWIFIHSFTGNPLVTIYNIINIIVALYRYLFVS